MVPTWHCLLEYNMCSEKANKTPILSQQPVFKKNDCEAEWEEQGASPCHHKWLNLLYLSPKMKK